MLLLKMDWKHKIVTHCHVMKRLIWTRQPILYNNSHALFRKPSISIFFPPLMYCFVFLRNTKAICSKVNLFALRKTELSTSALFSSIIWNLDFDSQKEINDGMEKLTMELFPSQDITNFLFYNMIIILVAGVTARKA